MSRLPRLQEYLVGSPGEAAFELKFHRDQEHRPVVTGHIRAMIPLRCQRCLDQVMHEVSIQIALAIVDGLEEVRRLPEGYDPLLAEAGRMRPLDLIEEELLLSLPQIPMHAPGDCSAAVTTACPPEPEGRAGEAHPFAGLADWKRGQ